jgi:hypothetical protein
MMVAINPSFWCRRHIPEPGQQIQIAMLSKNKKKSK